MKYHMQTMVTTIYEALKEAGASEEKAKAAAETAATFVRNDDETLARQSDLIATKETLFDVKSKVAVVRAELKMVKWIVSGIGFGIIILILERFL